MVELDGVAADLDQVKALALINYGHYTSMRVEDRRVRGLSLHLDRLVRDCRCVFDADLDPDRVRLLIRHALTDVDQPIVVRVTVFDPALEVGHLGSDANPSILVTTRSAARTTSLPAMRLQSATYRRDLPEVKHVGLFGVLSHRRAAQLNGFDDVLFTNADAMVCEAATSNVGFIDGDRIVWPRADCLPGVTMQLINQARDENPAVVPVTLTQIPDFDAAFASNAAEGVRGISAIDKTTWPDGHHVLHILRQQYADTPSERL